jgi:hypothetical protein
MPMILLDRRGHAERRHIDALAIMRVISWHHTHLGRTRAITAARELLTRAPHEPADWAPALVDGRAHLEGDTHLGLRLVYGN